MTPDDKRVLNKIVNVWSTMKASMQKMYQASDVRPADAYDIFCLKNGGNDEIKFEIEPVIFKVPERGAHSNPNLFIGVKGWLSFEGPFGANEPLRTKSFGTSVGYFRIKYGKIDHVYGVHYDCDENSFGHPVFHAQAKSQMAFLEEINRQFRQQWTHCDKVKGILRNVRMPSAEMDIFSVFIQICGDHLIHGDSGPEEKNAFSKMLESCGFFTGAANRMPNLYQKSQPYCYRSRHWYRGV